MYSDPQSFVNASITSSFINNGELLDVQNQMQYHWLLLSVRSHISFSCQAMNGIGEAKSAVRVFFSYGAAQYFYTNWPWVLMAACFTVILGLNIYYIRSTYRKQLGQTMLLPIAPGADKFPMREVSYVYDMDIDPDLEIKPSDIEVISIIDQGFFGTVYLARQSGNKGFVVLKAAKEEDNSLEEEIRLMSKISKNDYIIQLVGICYELPCINARPPYPILEYAQYGNLRNFLRTQRNIENDQYFKTPRINIDLKFVFDRLLEIAHGMSYLAKAGILSSF